MFGQSTPFLTVRDVFTGWIYAHPVVAKSRPEVERVLRHIIGAKLSYKNLVSDSAPELLAANPFNLAHFALTPERPQQSRHLERSNALVCELAGIYLHQSGLPKKIFWRAAVRTAATALSLIPRAGRKSAFELTFDTPSWLAEIPLGIRVLLLLGIFGCCLGANCRKHWKQSFRGRSSLRRSREYFRAVRPQYLVVDWLQVSGMQNSQRQELDDFEGELESEIEDEGSPVEEGSGTPKMSFEPPATENEIVQKTKRDEKVSEWHSKILVKPGVERTDWPDGIPVSAPSRSQRPPYISSMAQVATSVVAC
eukprot:3816348-Amphidinium_carterae.3